MTQAPQQVNPQVTRPADTFILNGRTVTVHDLPLTTGQYLTFTRIIDVREHGRTLARYEVIEARGRLTCARTAGTWDAAAQDTCYADLAAHAVQFDAALSAPGILKRLTPTEWIYVLPGVSLIGALDGKTLTIRTADEVIAVHTFELRKRTRTPYQVPGVGAWGDSLSGIRDLIRMAALPYLGQGVAA